MPKPKETTSTIARNQDWQFFVRCSDCQMLMMQQRNTGVLLTTTLGLPHVCVKESK